MAFLEPVLQDVVTVHHGHMPEIELTSPTTARGIWAMEDMLRYPDGHEIARLRPLPRDVRVGRRHLADQDAQADAAAHGLLAGADHDMTDTTPATTGVAVVTGGASGFGRALADRCAARGFDVALLDVDVERVPPRGRRARAGARCAVDRSAHRCQRHVGDHRRRRHDRTGARRCRPGVLERRGPAVRRGGGVQRRSMGVDARRERGRRRARGPVRSCRCCDDPRTRISRSPRRRRCSPPPAGSARTRRPSSRCSDWRRRSISSWPPTASACR